MRDASGRSDLRASESSIVNRTRAFRSNNDKKGSTIAPLFLNVESSVTSFLIRVLKRDASQLRDGDVPRLGGDHAQRVHDARPFHDCRPHGVWLLPRCASRRADDVLPLACGVRRLCAEPFGTFHTVTWKS